MAHNIDHELIRSPVPYAGSKYRTMEQIHKHLPENIDTLYDLFTGSMTVPLNVDARRRVCYEYDQHQFEILDYMLRTPEDELIEHFNSLVKMYRIGTEYRKYDSMLRDYSRKQDPLLLLLLITNSYMSQVSHSRFGVTGTPNTHRSSNPQHRLTRILEFKKRLSGSTKLIHGSCLELFKPSKLKKDDLVYMDPPYLITNASYNKSWTEEHEHQLYDLADKVDAEGGKFALSNVTHRNGVRNDILWKWHKKWNVHKIDISYSSMEHMAGHSIDVKEVLITNY